MSSSSTCPVLSGKSSRGFLHEFTEMRFLASARLHSNDLYGTSASRVIGEGAVRASPECNALKCSDRGRRTVRCQQHGCQVTERGNWGLSAAYGNLIRITHRSSEASIVATCSVAASELPEFMPQLQRRVSGHHGAIRDGGVFESHGERPGVGPGVGQRKQGNAEGSGASEPAPAPGHHDHVPTRPHLGRAHFSLHRWRLHNSDSS